MDTNVELINAARATAALIRHIKESGMMRYAPLDLHGEWLEITLAALGQPKRETGTVETRPAGNPLYVSPCRFGYDTVLGYLAKNNPEALDLIEDLDQGTQRDGFWLKHRASERGILVFKVPAPPVLQEKGIKEVNSYPVSLLAERLGA